MKSSRKRQHYYHGSKLVAQRKGIDPNYTLSYIHQDSLSSTSVMSTDAGASTGTIKYLPFGLTRSTSGTLDTDKKFTGQRLDDTGLYYYNARYYDPEIGRSISPDIYIQDFRNPQFMNRYSYCLNNPLKYTDPSGHVIPVLAIIAYALIVANVAALSYDVYQCHVNPSEETMAMFYLDAFDPSPIPWGPGKDAFKQITKRVTAKVIKYGDRKITQEAYKEVVKHFKSFTEHNYRDALIMLTGKTKESAKDLQAHHILPQELLPFFERAGFKGDFENIHNPLYLTWVDSTHQSWGMKYNLEWARFFRDNQFASKEQVLNQTRKMAKDYGFEVGF